MGEGATRPGCEALAAGWPERGRIRLHLYRFKAPRWAGCRAGILSRTRRRPRKAPGRALRVGSTRGALRIDSAADRGARTVVLCGKRPIHRAASAEALVRKLSFGGRPRRPHGCTALFRSSRPRGISRDRRRPALDDSSERVLQVAGARVAVLTSVEVDKSHS